MPTRTTCLLGIGLYAILSVLDFVLTFDLIHGTDGTAYEANPVAAAWLERHGWTGLALFKFGGVLAFLGAIGLMASRRPRVAVPVLGLGCAVLMAVTGYSHTLLASVQENHVRWDDFRTPARPAERANVAVADAGEQ